MGIPDRTVEPMPPEDDDGAMTLPVVIDEMDVDVSNIWPIRDAEGYTVCDAYGPYNARRIVAAVNHADALAEALRAVLPYVGTDAPFPRRVLDQVDDTLAAYDAAKEAQP